MSVKYLLHKHKNLSSISRIPIQKPDMVAYNPRALEVELGSFLELFDPVSPAYMTT